jgi:beta-1,4-mannosyl-glycoprotein beta-1,4-N-acetylglucosaminyltransferase
MIYDCFTFFNELDILELRLQLLYDIVDKFVLVESTKTHSNLEKELYYQTNKERFSKYNDKIIHVVVSTFPEYKNSWTIENYQRNQIFSALEKCNPDDLIMISDADEIPNPSIILNFNFENEVYCFVQDQYFFFYNYRDIHHLYWIGGTKAFKFKVIAENRFNEKKVKYNDVTFPAYLNKGITATKIRLYDGARFIYKAGWHFSYLGGVEAIFNKVRAFAHQELNNESFLNSKRIEECLISGEDVFGRKGHEFVRVDMNDKTHPQFIIQHTDNSSLFFTKSKIRKVPIFFNWYQLSKIKLIRYIKELF